MTSQNGKRIFTMHIFPNISRGKINQAMKLSQLIECIMKRNIFLEKSYNQKLGLTVWNVTEFVFFVYPIGGLPKCIETRCLPLGLISYIKLFSLFSRTILSVLLSAWFLKKNIFHITFHHLTKFHCLIAFIFWDIVPHVYFNSVFQFQIFISEIKIYAKKIQIKNLN